MLKEDEQESDRSAKLQTELEASILAILGKFTTFDVQSTEPLDDAMDAMDIDPEICMSTSATHAHAHAQTTTTREGLAFSGRRRIPVWETCKICPGDLGLAPNLYFPGYTSDNFVFGY